MSRWGVGGTVVSTRAFHLCDLGSIPAQCSYQIKIPPWSHVRRVFPVRLYQTPKTFSGILRFPNVQTLEQWATFGGAKCRIACLGYREQSQHRSPYLLIIRIIVRSWIVNSHIHTYIGSKTSVKPKKLRNARRTADEWVLKSDWRRGWVRIACMDVATIIMVGARPNN